MINLRQPDIGVCGDDQGIASKKKANRVDGVDKANRTGEADGCGADTEESDKVNRANGASGGGLDAKKPDRANKTD